MSETKDKAAGTDVTRLTQLQQDIREADAAVTARFERDGKELERLREVVQQLAKIRSGPTKSRQAQWIANVLDLATAARAALSAK